MNTFLHNHSNVVEYMRQKDCFILCDIWNNWMRILLIHVLVFGCICSFSKVNAQSSGDTEFWFVAPDAYNKNSDNPTFLLIVTGDQPATVNITQGGIPILTNQYVAANSYFKTVFTWAGDDGPVENLKSSSGTVTNQGIHITSTSQIVAYYQIDGSGAKEIFTLKGRNALGTDFYLPFQNVYRSADVINVTPYYDKAYQQIQIVATEDNTTVVVEPVAALNNGMDVITSNSSVAERTRVLNKGETLLWRANVNTYGYPSLTGSRVFSDKPIAVTLYEDCVVTPQTGGTTDAIGDQLVPINKLGKNYIVVKGFTSQVVKTYFYAIAKDHVGVLAVKNNTEVYLNGVLQTTLDKGEYWNYDLGYGDVAPGAFYINTSEPAYCMHQSGGSDELGGALLPSLYSISDKKTSFMKGAGTINNVNFEHYVFLVFRDVAKNGFTYNGSPMTVVPQNAGFGDWKYAKVSLPYSQNEEFVTIQNNDGAFALGYFMYGTGPTVASVYGYLSSFGFHESNKDTIVVCGNEYVFTTPYAETYSWTLPDGTGLNASSITAEQSGMYTLNLLQGAYEVADTFLLKLQNFSHRINFPFPTCVNEPNNFSIQLNPLRDVDNVYNVQYEWVFDGANIPTVITNKLNDITEVVSNVRWSTPGLKTVTLKITNLDANCDTIITSQIIVNPLPTISPINDQTVCLGASTSAVSYSGTLNPDSALWINDNSAIGLVSSGVGKIPAFTTLANGTATITVISRSTAGCYGNSETFTITIKEAFSDTINASICEGETYNFNGTELTDPGTYTNKLKTKDGCDSIVTLNLSYTYVQLITENAEICSDSSISFHGQEISMPGIYQDTLRSVSGCDSVIHTLNLSVKSYLNLSLNATEYAVCGSEAEINIYYTILEGNVSDYKIEFAEDSGLSEINGVTFSSPIFVALGNVNVGTKIKGKLKFFNQCGNNEFPITFTIQYPDSIITQRWNDVLSVRNSIYNGGYEFSSFQWYKDGVEIPGATKSYLYVPEGLDFNAAYAVNLIQQGQTEAILSCGFIPEYINGPITIYPTSVKRGMHLTVEVPTAGTVSVYDIMGLKQRDYNLEEGKNTVNAPDQTGIYLYQIRLNDGNERTYRISVSE